MTARMTSSRGRPPTSSRPISSRKGAGFSSGGCTTSGGRKVISPLDHMADTFAQFLKDTTDAPESKIKAFKKNIMAAVQESSNLIAKGDFQNALTKAKDAKTEMKNLQDFITSKTIDDADFKSYKHTVLMQLADAYKRNSMWEDALNRYQRLLKDREFPHLHMIYLEIGNIYSAQQKYEEAIKNYEMGINHLKPDTNRLMARFHQCCGIAHIQLGDYHKALSEFETAMRQDPSVKTGYNLVLCHSVLSSMDELKDAYVRLLTVKPPMTIAEMNDSDVLGNQMHIERREQVRLVMLASRLVATKSEKDWQQSYEFVLQQLKRSKYPEAAGEFEIAYSLAYLNHQQPDKAIEMLRSIRKKDPSLMTLAATNLSFLYFLEQDFESADKYATIALDHDKYNAQALVNKGNCFMQACHEEEARDSYLEAIGVEADCVEALYNLGIVSKLMGSYDEALQVFDKLSRIVPKAPEVAFEISDCYDKIGMVPQAIDCLHRLFNLLPTDPAMWRKLGGIWDRDGNEQQAFHCYSESYKYGPSDIEVISWLGSYHRRHQHFDNALRFYERASAIAPKEPRYPLMVASCYRSMDMKQEALEVYEKVIQMDSSNKQCLEHLIKLTGEMGLTSKSEHYQHMLTELIERLQQMEQEEYQEQLEQQQNGFGFGGGMGMSGGLGGTGMVGFGGATGMTMGGGMAATGLGGTGIAGGIGGQAMNPMQFKQENVEAPALRMGDTGNNMVQKGFAGNGNDDLWEGVNIDLP
ncbi:TPR Domain containing protein [Tritrichomonas foetus]|uniref:TPR Domain containing protein n=1 Tax=Tritrichomonas foetus TaxID=1144522 RepID=A0A1J4J6K5_9EUKA|nr:TPR Domain containing protein [Tritrichomonas foetus]|eukprot:OHS94862.1 TPR Domain containing protein [Tritrichomonas foetus]